MTPAIVWVVTAALFIVGLAGVVIPVLPGIGFVFAGTLVYAWATGFSTISPLTIVVFGLLALLAWLADFWGASVGAKVGGGKTYALIGTVIGAVVGAVAVGPLGLLVGAFLGAMVGAVTEGATHQQALKVAALSVVGIVGGTVVQFLLSVAMIVAFFLAIVL